jgi:hypothetical protein
MPEASRSSPPPDISKQAHSIARIIDRVCRHPGTYVLTIEIPAHRRKAWRVRLTRQEVLRETTTREDR